MIYIGNDTCKCLSLGPATFAEVTSEEIQPRTFTRSDIRRSRAHGIGGSLFRRILSGIDDQIEGSSL